MQRDEATDNALKRASRWYCTLISMEHNASSSLLKRFGKPGFELKDHPIKRGIDWKWLPTLADLVCRKIKTKERAEQITGFVNNIGLGAQFAAVGARVYKNARRRSSVGNCPSTGSRKMCIRKVTKRKQRRKKHADTQQR